MSSIINSTKYTACFSDGKWIDGESDVTIKVINPSTNQEIVQWQSVSKLDTKKAINSASQALVGWRETQNWQRAKILHDIAGVMRSHFKEAAHYLALELGKPLAQGEREWQMCIDQFEWYGDVARRHNGTMIKSRAPSCQYYLSYEPVGVVGAFTAWNFPPLLSSRKIAPALAAGCSIVLRPSSQAPLSVMLLIECCRKSGVPDGVVNLIVGNIDNTYDVIMKSKEVRKVSLTGSTEVGKQMIRDSADTVKRLSMELGGNAPVIVFDDIDVESVVKQAVGSKHANAGQVCASPDRFYIHETIFEEFVEKYVEQVKQLIVGDPLNDENVTMGPVVSSKRLTNLEKTINQAVEQGATLHVGGKKIDRDGFFFAPTVLTNADDLNISNCSENFGPITVINSFKDENDVLKRVNSVEVGLASYLFTNNNSIAQRILPRIESGMVSHNTFALASAEMPFGGIKQSGYGREGGAENIKEFCNLKVVHSYSG